MAKAQKSYICSSCGAISHRWSGKCEACQEWNTITEEISVATAVPRGLSAKGKGNVIDFEDLRNDKITEYKRHNTGIDEFDRVTGGGIVPGAAILIGGDPGIGKSTLLLQSVCALMKNKVKELRFYVAVDNLFTITKYQGFDPAASSGQPIGAGFDAGFYPAARTFWFGLTFNI